MRLIITLTLLLLCPIISPALSFASDEPPPVAANSPSVDLLLERAISQNLIAGGVVVIGNRDGIISTSAKGQLNSGAAAPQLDEHTVFDVASLTKVIATAPAVMKLAEEGKINLTDPVSNWFPEFAGIDLTVLHLLTHTSGLEDVSVSSDNPMQSAINKAAAQRPQAGTHFRYADINFIILGELVQRVSGETLNQFCQERIYAPLGAQGTMFLPPQDISFAIVPTSGDSAGVVQDPNARRLGGVAGHAGLFSSAYDLSRYARLMLGGGVLEDKRILSEQAVAQMTTPYLCNNGRVLRGLGWDMQSAFSAPKGSFFSGSSFGHTGYSGSSIWIDPQQDLFVILLTKRVNYSDTKRFNQFRRDISTFAVAGLKMPDLLPALAESLEATALAAKAVPAAAPVKEAGSERHQVKLVAKAKFKSKSKLQLARHRSARMERTLAKAGAGRRTARYAQVARAAKTGSCKSTPAKKKRTLRKG